VVVSAQQAAVVIGTSQAREDWSSEPLGHGFGRRTIVTLLY
jgi:hypothetical protein